MKGLIEMKELDFDINEFLKENEKEMNKRMAELEREGFSFRIPYPNWEDIKDYLYPW